MLWVWKNSWWRGRAYAVVAIKVTRRSSLRQCLLWSLDLACFFFSFGGTNNDINLLSQPSLFRDIVKMTAPPIEFKENRRRYNMGYYLADEINPKWLTFVSSTPHTTDPKSYSLKQSRVRAEGCRASLWSSSDATGNFCSPSQLWFRDNMRDVMDACIILHNMIVEDEGKGALDWKDQIWPSSNNTMGPDVTRGPTTLFRGYVKFLQSYMIRMLTPDSKAILTKNFGHVIVKCPKVFIIYCTNI